MWMWMGPWMVNGWVVREVSRELWIGDFISGLWFATWETPTPVLWNRFQRRLWMVGWLGATGGERRERKQAASGSAVAGTKQRHTAGDCCGTIWQIQTDERRNQIIVHHLLPLRCLSFSVENTLTRCEVPLWMGSKWSHQLDFFLRFCGFASFCLNFLLV